MIEMSAMLSLNYASLGSGSHDILIVKEKIHMNRSDLTIIYYCVRVLPTAEPWVHSSYSLVPISVMTACDYNQVLRIITVCQQWMCSDLCRAEINTMWSKI